MKELLKEISKILNEDSVVKVPKFNYSREAKSFFNNLMPGEIVDKDIMDPDTGEIYLEAGIEKSETPEEPKPKKEKLNMKFDYIFSKDNVEDFNNHYDVEYQYLPDILDNDIEYYRERNFDVELEFPEIIRKKDSSKFTKRDKTNINRYIDYYNKYILDGANLKISIMNFLEYRAITTIEFI